MTLIRTCSEARDEDRTMIERREVKSDNPGILLPILYSRCTPQPTQRVAKSVLSIVLFITVFTWVSAFPRHVSFPLLAPYLHRFPVPVTISGALSLHPSGSSVSVSLGTLPSAISRLAISWFLSRFSLTNLLHIITNTAFTISRYRVFIPSATLRYSIARYRVSL